MDSVIFPMENLQPAKTVGGKAEALMILREKGFNVPPFFAISADAFAKDGLKPSVKPVLKQQLKNIKPGPFAVRSSATEEDGVAQSHAGQFLSVLNVTENKVAAAARRVAASGNAEHVTKYRKSHNLSSQNVTPAVLVQRMVKARCAGVAFTADPVSGRRDRMIISAVSGLAETLVSGEVDGETTILHMETGEIIENVEGGVLSPADLKKLHELCEKVADSFGAQQDIEWAFEGEELFLLQSRPITSQLRPKVISDSKKIVFDNSNIIESYPGMVTPLTYSFAQYVYARVYRSFVLMLGVSPQTVRENAAVFDNMLARIDGRVYYNLNNWYRALALLPGFSKTSQHMETMMGVDEPLPADIFSSFTPEKLTGFAKLKDTFRIVRVGGGLAKEAVLLRRTRAQFYKRLNSVLSPPIAGLATMSLSELVAEYRRIESTLLDQWDAPLINDFLCMFAFGSSRKLLEKWGGAEGVEAHNAIMVGQGDIVSAEPAQRIRAMGEILASHPDLKSSLAVGDGGDLASVPELVQAVDSYIEKFGDRCVEELKLESVTLDRDPTSLYMAMSAATDVVSRKEDDKEENDVDPLKALFKGKPIRRILSRPFVHWAKHRVRDRENLRFERTRVFGRARRILRAIGQQFYAGGYIDDPADIFYLTIQEVLGAVEGFSLSSDLRAPIADRKPQQASDARLPDRESRIIVNGSMVSGVSKIETPKAAERDLSVEQNGTGCSAGIVTARARVIKNPATERLEKGDILVAKYTDPGWIAVFTNASAIIVERGSLLSHSAIVARELGIPCVVGLKGVMNWIQDGELIEVDGATGRVRRCHD